MTANSDDYTAPDTPKRGDKLFVQDKANWKMNAMLDPRSGDSFAYREGYRMAGRILTESAAEGRGEVDLLVYPICHSYRHYVELTLKQLMLLGCEIVSRELTPYEVKLHSESHDLSQLWACFKRIEKEVSKELGGVYPANDMDGIAAYIEQLHKVDKGSYSFRYPLTKSGAVSLGTLERINLTQFSEKMERLCASLELIECGYRLALSEIEEMYSGCSPY